MVKRWRSTAIAAVILAACTGSGTAGPATSSIPAVTSSSGADPATSSAPASTSSSIAQTATVDDLTGEWQPMPFTISDAALQQMDEQCLSDDFMPSGMARVVADARGEGRIDLIYAREDRHNGTCVATVTSQGIEAHSTSATVEFEPVTEPPMGATGLKVWGGETSPGSASPEDWYQSMMGEAGTGIHQVIVQVPGMPPIVASLGGGWFTFWYNVEAEEQWAFQLVGLDSAGNEIAREAFPPTG
ncbi:MAG: hypothetical protein ABW021_01805 [Acidimicrobiia bacterium]